MFFIHFKKLYANSFLDDLFKGLTRYSRCINRKVTKLGSRKLHFPKSDQDGVYNWPKNRLKWGSKH